mgnify:CR=1 FL=1
MPEQDKKQTNKSNIPGGRPEGNAKTISELIGNSVDWLSDSLIKNCQKPRHLPGLERNRTIVKAFIYRLQIKRATEFDSI